MECEAADASPPTAEVLFPSRTVRMNTVCFSQPRNTAAQHLIAFTLDLVRCAAGGY